MVRIRFVFLFMWIILPSWSQESPVAQDPAAGQILDRVAAKTQSMKSIQADYELVVEDRKDKTKNTSSGNLLIRQNKYRINSEGSTVYFNGKTMWTYMSEPNEVTITEPGTQADDFMSNPAIFSPCTNVILNTNMYGNPR